MERREAAQMAIQEAGGARTLAESLAAEYPDQDPQLLYYRVNKWRQNGVPPKFVLTVERITGVSRHLLHPEIYPKVAA